MSLSLRSIIGFTIIITVLFFHTSTLAQRLDSVENYRRSSIYSLMLNPGEQYAHEIETVFLRLPQNDKFNNHDLSIKSIPDQDKSSDKREKISLMLSGMDAAKGLVSLWFNRDSSTGAFNMDLVAERGNYDASILDLRQALASARGLAMLSDAGEDLIGNTFVLVNDIRYVDKEKGAKIASTIFSIIGATASAVSSASGSSNSNTRNIADATAATAFLGEVISDAIIGFTVKITSYLYRLNWNDSVSAGFYNNYYFDSLSIDPLKMVAYDNDKELFSLNFVGSQTVTSDKTSVRGLSTAEDMIRKTMRRALDKSIVELQRKNEVFKIKVPLISTDPITAYVGLKEGVNEKSVFEVLERRIDEDGRIKYVRVATIAPEKGKIWDNRFMAVEEQATDADLGCTTFRKISGNNLYQGMLIREIKFK